MNKKIQQINFLIFIFFFVIFFSNKKPKYSFEEPEESSVDITPSSSSSMEMEAAAAKQVDIILKTLRADASVDITPSSSSSMEASAAKQVDIVLKTSGTERLSATSTCEKAVAPAGAATEKSVRTIAINLTISEDQIRTWLDVPDTENSKKQTRKVKYQIFSVLLIEYNMSSPTWLLS